MPNNRTTPAAAGSRAACATALVEWLKKGGPSQITHRRPSDAPPLVMFNDVEFAGGDDNVFLRATKDIAAGSLILAVAKSSVFEPRSAAVPPARQKQVAKAAEALQGVAEWCTPLVDAGGREADAGKIQLIVLLALELLEQPSVWQVREARHGVS